MYTIERTVAFSETGPDKMMKLTNLIDYYQDVCTFQSEEIGVGTAFLRENKVGWVASSWQVEVNRYPRLDEKILVSTFPYDFKGAMGMRNFLMETPEGELLSRANSIWSLINTETMMLTRATPEIVSAYALEPKLDMDYAPRKIKDPVELAALSPVPVEYRHLDYNNHVNNAQYIAIAEDLDEGLRRASSVRVEYRASARPGQVIYPYISRGEGTACTMVLADADTKPYVLIEFK